MIYFLFFNCNFLLKNSQETVSPISWLLLLSNPLTPPLKNNKLHHFTTVYERCYFNVLSIEPLINIYLNKFKSGSVSGSA